MATSNSNKLIYFLVYFVTLFLIFQCSLATSRLLNPSSIHFGGLDPPLFFHPSPENTTPTPNFGSELPSFPQPSLPLPPPPPPPSANGIFPFPSLFPVPKFPPFPYIPTLPVVTAITSEGKQSAAAVIP
ncbi:hypothetical protein M5689_006371 [Euphorbia peplus]|nr:hypothetical protein M5689_006371 [Euphorbia peplus]